MEDQIITIASYPYSRAILLKGRFEAEGIECFLSNINLVQPHISTGVKIKIAAKDTEMALKIIDELKEGYGKAKQKAVEKLKNIRRILVPVDFSEQAENACDYALGLATKLKAEIKLVYSYFNPIIISEPYFDNGSFYHQLDEVVKNVAAESKDKMTELVSLLKQKAINTGAEKLKISYVLERGTPEDVILNVSHSWDPGVIVMGIKGMNDSANDYLGQVTKKVLKRAKMPVLVIPQSARFLGIDYISRVLYATDFDDSDFKTLRILMSLLRPFQVRLYCVHIHKGKDSTFDHAKMERLKEHFKEEYNDYDLHCDLVLRDDLIQGLEEYIEEKEIDFLALTTHKRGFIERMFNPSLAKQMLFKTNIPLLIFQS